MKHTYLLVAEESVLPIIRFTIESIYKYGNPKEVIIITPESQIKDFKSAVINNVQIVSEQCILPEWGKDDIRQYLKTHPERAGWYLQQFLKIEYSRNNNKGDYIIWDADTVMLKSLRYIEDETIFFNRSKEMNPPYFDTLEKLLGIKRLLPTSVISQYIYIKRDVAVNLINEIENKHQNNWIKTVLLSIKQEAASEFSEYETYANYYASIGGKFKLDKKRWFRYGSEIINPKNVKRLSDIETRFKGYNYVAFERHRNRILKNIYAKLLLTAKISS